MLVLTMEKNPKDQYFAVQKSQVLFFFPPQMELEI